VSNVVKAKQYIFKEQWRIHKYTFANVWGGV